MNDNEIISLIQQYQNAGNDLSSIAAATQSLMSTPKTPLGLNQWQPEDKPRMEHFNEDNRRIDELLSKKAEKGAPAEYDLALMNGIETYQGCCYSKDAFGRVTVDICCSKKDHFQTREQIAALPEGFRPRKTCITSSVVCQESLHTPGDFASEQHGAILTVDIDGAVGIHFLLDNAFGITGQVSFLAAD